MRIDPRLNDTDKMIQSGEIVNYGQAEKWEELKRKVVFQKYSQTVERREYRLPDGKVADYYIHVAAPGACVLAFTTDNRVITIPQYRPGPDAVLRELPGGRVDDGEDRQKAAMRELLEETGYSGDAEEWAATWQADAYTQQDRSAECRATVQATELLRLFFVMMKQ